METQVSSTFLKQLAHLPDGIRERVERFAFDELPNFQSLSVADNIKRLQGYRNCYRARFGDYRVGIEMEDGVAVLKVVLHRRDVYRRFP